MTFTSALNVYSDRLIAAPLRADAEVYRHAKRVVLFDLAYLVWVCAFAAFLAALGSPRCGLITLWCTLPILASLRTIGQGGSPTMAANVLCLGGWTTLTAISLLLGGAVAPLIWLVNMPLIAVMTCGLAWGIAWTIIPLATVVAIALARAWAAPLPSELSAGAVTVFEFVALGGILACMLWVAALRVGVEQRARIALSEANRRLAQAREDLLALEEGFGFSMTEWENLKREKAALEFAMQARLDCDREVLSETDASLEGAETSLDELLGLTRRKVRPGRQK